MAYISKENLIAAYNSLSKLTDDPSAQGATQAASSLRYLFALAQFYIEFKRPCNTRDKADKNKFTEFVGNVVKINDIYYTANFYDAIKNDADFKVGSNFFSVNVVKTSLENQDKEYIFPKRGNSPLFNVRNGLLILNHDYFQNLDSLLHDFELRSAFAVWLVRNDDINVSDIYNSIKHILCTRYSDLLALRLLPNNDEFQAFGDLRFEDSPAQFTINDFPKPISSDSSTKQEIIMPEQLIEKVKCGFERFLMLTNKQMENRAHYINVLEKELSPLLANIDDSISSIYQVVSISYLKSLVRNLVLQDNSWQHLQAETWADANVSSSKYFIWTIYRQYYNYLSIIDISDFRANINEEIPLNKLQLKPDQPLQQIFYGAPGTGKSFAIDNMADDDRTVRTTFHPDSDYASFVGAYKPTMEDVPINSIYGESVQFAIGKNGHPGTERKIVYKYVPQAFLKAYIEAWKDLDNPHYLVIEEINRGNCAQIFGDLFQLLDRNAMGCSSYAIHADDDIRQFLASDEKGFGGLSEEQAEAIRSFVLVKDNGSQKQIGEQILNGEQLLLPPNLYIWATMNTSDQSLFPIDSAFKRRWNWKFVPINYEQKNWLLHIGDSYYRWGDFLKKINPIIFSLTESSDKQMGYFFAKPDEKIGQNDKDNNTISEDIFLNKVLFYIWTDILKDFDAGKEPFINPETGRAYEFSDFFDNQKNRVVEFITKPIFGLEEVDVDDEPSNAEEEERQSKRSKYSSLTVSFLDGSVIKEETFVATYLKAIEKIGIEKAAEVAATLKYKRRGHALITKEPVQELLDNNYTYATIGGYSVLKGIKTKSLVLLLRQINDVCNLGLNITLE